MMLNYFRRIKKADDTRRFADNVQKELIEQKHIEWKRKIADYVYDNKEAPYIGSTVIKLWCILSEALRNACYYKEALLISELAVRHSKNLTEDFKDIQIQALQELGIAQLECMMVQKGIASLESAWKLIMPKVRLYEQLRFSCGMNLASVYTRTGQYEESNRILDDLWNWITKEKPSGINNGDILLAALGKGNNLFSQGRYKEGLRFAEGLEEKARKLNMQDNSVYYKILSLLALFEKMNNHMEKYYKLTKQAITYAGQAGDIQEVRAYQVNLLDALIRMGKNEELLLNVHDTLSEFGDDIDSLNVLQFYMNVLMRLSQISQMTDDIQVLYKKAVSAWETMKRQGIALDSRETLKIQSQFACIKLLNMKFAEAEAELNECFEQSRKVLGEGDIDTLSIQYALANSKRMQRKFKEALDVYLEIEKLRRHNGQEETHSYFETLRSIAYMYYYIGEKKEAVRRMLVYFDKIDKYSYEVFLLFDEPAWKAFSADFLNTLHDILGWLAADEWTDNETEQIYNLVLRFKNRLYDEEMLWKARKKSPVTGPKLTEYYHLLKESGYTKSEEERIRFLNKKKRLEEEISNASPETLLVAETAESLRKNLNNEEAVLDYVRYNKADGCEDVGRKKEGYLVFFITRGKIKVCDLGKSQNADEEMEEFYHVISLFQCSSDYLEQQLVQVKAGLGLLDFADDIKNFNKIYIGLDGEWMPKMPWHYILAGHEVQVLPTFALLGRQPYMKSFSDKPDWKMAFFARPELPLAETKKREAESALLIAGASEALLNSFLGNKLQVFVGKEANRETFISISSPKVLHAAVHGAFVSENSQMQKSVMLMSSRKKTDKPEEFDGTVTMLDVMQMDLDGTDLVVLNSCETGIGDFGKDEGVYGFARAFFIAGADGVLTSLWKVDALFSVIFLDIFYKDYLVNWDMEKALFQSRRTVRKMTAEDVIDWLEVRKADFGGLEEGEKILKIMEDMIREPGKSENLFVFDKPAYWACFTLARRTK